MKIALSLIASISLAAAFLLPAREPDERLGADAEEAHTIDNALRLHHTSASCSGSGSAKARPAARKRPSNNLTATYRAMRARWHRPPTAAQRASWNKDGAPLVIRPVHGSEEFTLRRDPETGEYDSESHEAAMLAFQWKADGAMHPIEERLLSLVHDAAAHFKAPYVHLISGYRNRAGRNSSRHNQGRAADIVLPGISDARLAAYLRRQGYVGVGLYPVSGFTHIDVRERSYYWVDRSGPGQRSRSRSIMPDAVAQNDARARRRGVEPTAPYDPAASGAIEIASAESVDSDEPDDRPILASAESAVSEED